MQRVFSHPLQKLLLIAFMLFALLGQPMSWSVTARAHHHAAVDALQGFVDVADCRAISGWAADSSRLNTPITVKVLDGTTVLTSILANLNRPDVGTFLNDNGLHGYNFSIPLSLRDNLPHTIHVVIDGGPELTNSPRTLTCAPLAAIAIGVPQITRFEIEPRFAQLRVASPTTTDSFLRVIAEFDRNPAFFRLAEVRNLSDPEPELRAATWRPYTPGMSLSFRLDTSRPYGTRNVFMQINNGSSESGASRPKGDSIIFAPTSTKTFVLTGADLSAFINRAKELHYHFSITGPTVIGRAPCSPGLRVADYNTLQRPDIDASQNFTERWSAVIFERSGDDRFLNQFWKVREIRMADLFPPSDFYRRTVSGPLSGRDDDLNRTINWQSTYRGNHDAFVTCVSAGFEDPPIVSITLEGPSDKPAVEAFRSQ